MKYKPTSADKTVSIESSVWFRVWQSALSIQRELEFYASSNGAGDASVLDSEAYLNAIKAGFDAETRYLECLGAEQYFDLSIKKKNKPTDIGADVARGRKV